MRAQAERILIDATMTRRGGGFTYLVNLAPRLAALAPERSFLLLLRSQPLAAALPRAENLELRLLPETGLVGRLLFSQLRAARLARAWRADVYFAAGDLAPLRPPCPAIASFRNPNVFTSLDQDWYAYQIFRLGLLRRLSRLTARACDRILFVSHDSARWIGDSIGLPDARRAVVPHGIDAARFAAAGGPPPWPRPYVLSVSSIYRYKNFVRLIEAWGVLAGLRGEIPDLVIVGDDMDPAYTAKMHAARRHLGRLSARIHIVGEVPYAEIPRWYRGALAFAFPSYLETFGHPLLEAMAAGVPVVAADIPVSREVAAEAALYADPHDPVALARALERALYDAAARDDLVRRGRERVREFDWDASARGHLALFDEVAAERRDA
jgi:glycosyltransferase involved in cell wall biosynthesis